MARMCRNGVVLFSVLVSANAIFAAEPIEVKSVPVISITAVSIESLKTDLKYLSDLAEFIPERSLPSGSSSRQ